VKMWHTLSTNEVEKKIGTNINYGLKEKQIEERKIKYGKNQLEEQKKKSISKPSSDYHLIFTMFYFSFYHVLLY